MNDDDDVLLQPYEHCTKDDKEEQGEREWMNDDDVLLQPCENYTKADMEELGDREQMGVDDVTVETRVEDEEQGDLFAIPYDMTSVTIS